jgi:GTPase SAR1 family protein
MDPEDMQLYTKMLEKGKVKTYNIRLMFVGLYGAGKTSTARRILGQKIDDVTSTDGIDVHTGRCKVDIRRRKWEIYNGKMHLHCKIEKCLFKYV